MTDTAVLLGESELAIILGRKSQVRLEAEADTIERQFSDGDRYAEHHRDELGNSRPLHVVKRLFDLESGYKDRSKKARAGLRESLRMIEAGEAKHLIVARLDRLTRQGPLAFLQILDRITKAGGYLHILDAPGVGHIDTSNPIGVGFLALLAAFAQQWAHQTSVNVKRAERDNAAAGKRHGGMRPYGWHQAPKTLKDAEGNDRSPNCPSCGEEMPTEEVKGKRKAVIELCPVESKVLREIASRILKTPSDPYGAIAVDFNNRKIRTAGGNLWTAATIRKALSSPAISGKRTHLGIEYDGDFPAILTPEEHADVLAVIGKARGTTHVLGQQPLLSGMGILFCECGARLRASKQEARHSSKDNVRTGRQSNRYRCSNLTGRPGDGCGRVTAVQSGVDEAVKQRIFNALRHWQNRNIFLQADQELERWKADLADDKKSLKELTNARYIDRTSPLYGNEEEFRPVYETLKKRIEEAEGLIAATERPVDEKHDAMVPGPGETMDEWWAAKSIQDRRTIVRYYVKEIVVKRVGKATGPKFDPTRVTCRFFATDEEAETA